jgi:hypothetical protein
MSHVWLPTLKALGLMAGMFAMLEVGWRIGRHGTLRGRSPGGTGALEGALFALLGLMIAFTFSGAASRFDSRRALIVQEANDIGTAYLRVDLLSQEAQPAIRDAFRRYTDSRIKTYEIAHDAEAARAEYRRSQAIQAELWARSTQACDGRKDAATTSLVLASLNTMFDTASTRSAAVGLHPPGVVFGLLFILALGCALVAGHATAVSAERHWMHRVAFTLAMAISFYVILDLEYPRRDLIRVDAFDHLLVEARRNMR